MRTVTRMAPKRAWDLLGGGSLYWVIKGQIAARQRIVGVEPFIGSGGIGRCRLWLDGEVIAVARPMRPFQSWRCYEAKSAPADIDEASPASPPCRRACAVNWRRSGCFSVETGRSSQTLA